MSKAVFKGYVVNEMEFVNELRESGKLELKNELKYNVKYSEQQCECMGECRFKVYHSQRPDLFSIEVSVRGFFKYEEGADKKELHAETYDQLFPYVRSLISTITVNCGMPPITIPKIKIGADNVVIHQGAGQDKYYS